MYLYMGIDIGPWNTVNGPIHRFRYRSWNTVNNVKRTLLPVSLTRRHEMNAEGYLTYPLALINIVSRFGLAVRR